MSYIYDFFISNKVSFEQVTKIVSDYTNIAYEKIGTMDECIDKFGTIDELIMAIDIYFNEKGYKTYVELNQLAFKFEEYQIPELAFKLATSLNSNIAIVDQVDCGEFNYIIISPDKKYQKAYGVNRRKEDEKDEIKEFTTYSEKADIDEYICRLNDE